MPDYYKINRGRKSTAKTNSSVFIGSPYSKPIQILNNYSFFQPDQQISGSFVRAAQKKNVAKPDLPILKQTMSGEEADRWKKAMQVEYDAFISNGTWKLVDLPSDQHVLTGNWALKRKRDMDGNKKRYKARLVARGFK